MRQGHPRHAWMRGPAMMGLPRGTWPHGQATFAGRDFETPRCQRWRVCTGRQKVANFCLDLLHKSPNNLKFVIFPYSTVNTTSQQFFVWEPQVQSMLHLFDVKVKECQQKLVGTFVVTCVVFVCMLASGCHKFTEAKKSGNHRNMLKISSFVKGPRNVETHSSIFLAFSKDASHLRMPVSRTSGSVSLSAFVAVGTLVQRWPSNKVMWDKYQG